MSTIAQTQFKSLPLNFHDEAFSAKNTQVARCDVNFVCTLNRSGISLSRSLIGHMIGFSSQLFRISNYLILTFFILSSKHAQTVSQIENNTMAQRVHIRFMIVKNVKMHTSVQILILYTVLNDRFVKNLNFTLSKIDG